MPTILLKNFISVEITLLPSFFISHVAIIKFAKFLQTQEPRGTKSANGSTNKSTGKVVSVNDAKATGGAQVKLH